MAIGGDSVKTSAPAGLVFAVLLGLLVVARGTRFYFNKKSLLVGLVGAVVLVLPLTLVRNIGGHTPAGSFWHWALVVGVVAIAEEAYLRGVLYDTLQQWRGKGWAIVIGAIIFGLMHIPLYGLQALPLDIVVGAWLGGLRAYSGSFVAPALAHTLADLAGWWLR